MHQCDSLQIAELRSHNSGRKRFKHDFVAKLELPPPGMNIDPYAYRRDKQFPAYLTCNRVPEGISDQGTTIGVDSNFLEEIKNIAHSPET